MWARSFFRAAMFLLVQLAGIYLAHASKGFCTAPQPSSNSKDAPRHNRPHTALPTMSARSFFRAAMFLLVQLAGIYLEHAAGFPSGCTGNPNQRPVSCPPGSPNQPCQRPPCLRS
ncbi:hypothetical protein PVAP13_8KG317606 [Panicum virgatum]|uniref:Secreted protein n=1 Tax=Panicum virgatum TaxID=38727 RepID=A0A8T0PTP2_PANVG|nr:hypothetical protein PVAP13_8KG317606 [Panicum virgatum]